MQNFTNWLEKRIRNNRRNFIANFDPAHWHPNKYIDYKNKLYVPIHLDWPQGRDYGTLTVKPVGLSRKLQSGTSTKITQLDPNHIKIQISRNPPK